MARTNPEQQGPPKHEETLASLHGADPDEAQKYAENPPTGTGTKGTRSAGAAEDEETFGHTDKRYRLSEFDSYETADDIVAANAEGKFTGIGDATAKEIITARRKRDRAK